MLRRIWLFKLDSHLQGWLSALIAIIMLAVVGADAANLVASRNRAIGTAQAETANLSRSLADQAHGVFQSMDTVLVGLRERVEMDGTGPDALKRLRKLLQLRVQALPMIHRIMVVDAAGRIVLASGSAPPASVAGIPIFRHHAADADRSSFLGWPIRDSSDGSMVLSVSRRVDDAGGGFAGLVVISIGTEFFRHAYAGFDTGRQGAILLARADGIAMARWPPDPRGEARDLSQGDFFSRIVGPGDRPKFQYASLVDGLLRFSSYTRVPDEPALVLVGRGRHEVLAAWRLTACIHALALFLTLGIIALLGRFLARKIGEVERAQDVLRETNLRLAHSEANARRANAWMEMAEQIAQVGHWHMELADLELPSEAPLRQTIWSDELYRIHGFDRNSRELTRTSLLNVYHPDDRAAVRAAFGAVVASLAPYEFVGRLVRPDGSMRHVLNRGVPEVNTDGVLIGAFGVVMDITEQKRSEALLHAAHADAESANRALEAANQLLETMAMQDALTELSNRRHFDRALDHDFRRALRAAAPLALILIDVDHFKQFNDLYGHQAGDACLRRIAAVIPPLLNRPSDTVARYGGEEIAVLLPGCTDAGVVALAQRIGQAVRSLAIPHAGSAHGVVTISAGTEAFVSVHARVSAADLVEHADQALYAAKRAGRDSVFTFADLGIQVARAAGV